MSSQDKRVYTLGEVSIELCPRWATALAYRLSGLKLREVGDKLGGVTRERARQVINRAKRQVEGQFKAQGKSAEAAAEFLARATEWQDMGAAK